MDRIDSSESDFENYSETSATDYGNDETESSYGGHAQSILSSLDQSIGRIDDYLAFERGFVHGDIVCSIKDLSGNLGRVTNLDIFVHLESQNGEIITEVNTKKLLRVRSFEEGDYVVHGPWLGRVDGVYDVVTVLLDDGTKCKICTKDDDDLVPLSVKLFEDGPFAFYPGLRVMINDPTKFKSPRWLCGGSWNDSPTEGTICKVEADTVIVNWIASVMVASNTTLLVPSCLQDVANLTLLSCYINASWQLGDWCKLSPDYFQNLAKDKDYVFPCLIPKNPIEMEEYGIRSYGHDQIFTITKTKTKVDVLWQDGEHTCGLDLQDLSPINTISDHDFWPGQFVLEKAILERDTHVSNVQRGGIVKHVNALDKIVNVKWSSLERDCHMEFFEETISAYELIEHPDHSYTLGDIIFRALPKSEASKDVPNHLEDLHKFHLMKDPNYGDCDNYTFCYLSCIGNVIGFKDDGVEVRWADGVVSKVKHLEIFGIENLVATTSIPVLINEDAVIEESFMNEISQQEGRVLPNKEKDLLRDLDNRGNDYIYKLFAPINWIPQATEFLLNTASDFLDFHGFRSLSTNYTDENLENEEGSDLFKLDEPIPNIEDTILEFQVPMHVTSKNNQNSVPVKVNEPFKSFDVVDDHSDHFFDDNENRSVQQVERSWLKKVNQEWNLLARDLPDTIYVRTYEQRMDLLSASIVGSSGTPYQDALFFFDICLPPEYPLEPPMVHYISRGIRLNPNLYESGKVCLSLLKTWSGSGTEVWNPESSTILQVLLSLQALVLNEKPYFNEAGYDKHIGRAEGLRNSITYNENAFLLSRKSMLYQLNDPPKNFEPLIHEHFSSRSHKIINTCEALIEGSKDRCDFGCGELIIAASGKNTTSAGFRIMLAKLVPKLILTFSDRGINCNSFSS